MCSLGRDILNGNCVLQMREIWALWSWRGVLYLKPYLTAWINSPLFRCWAGTHPLLVLSFNNHAGFLKPAPVYSIIYRNNKPGVHCAGQSTVHHYTAGHARMTEVPAVWICQWTHVKPNCIKSLFKSFSGSPSHILKCSPDLNRSSLHPPGPLVYQKVFLKQKSMESSTVFWELSIHTGKNVKRRPWGSLWSCVFFGLCESFRGEM